MIVKSQAEMAKNLELVSSEVQTQINGKASTVHTHDISAIVDTGYPVIRPSLNLDFANSKTVDPRITFTRASSGTIYNEDGLIESVASGVPRITHNPVTGECEGLLVEEARTNLLTYSEQFDNAAWTKLRATVLANTTSTLDPYGTNLADVLIEDSTASISHYIYTTANVVIGVTYTFSVFIKAKDSRMAKVQLSGINGAFNGASMSFDPFTLTTLAGAVAPAASSITTIGNGWVRITITGTAIATALATISLSIITSINASAVYTGDGTSGLYIFGAQLEAGTEPSSYIPSTESFTSRASTATYHGSDGLLKSAPVDTVRMNYNPTNLKVAPKMLFEGAGTNLLTYSEQFDKAAWTKVRATVVANATTAPDGTLSADKLVEDTTASVAHFLYARVSGTTNSNAYTFSVFVKAGERSRVDVDIVESPVYARFAYAYFDVSNGVVSVQAGTSGGASSASATMTHVGGGWYRCSVSTILGGSQTALQGRVFLSNTSNSATYTGDGTSGLYIWGAQLEAGAFPTSYIPTTTAAVTRAADIYTSATSTRAAEICTMTGTNFSDWYRQDEGTIVVEAECTSSSTKTADIVAISDGTISNKIKIRHLLGTTSDSTVVRGGVPQVDTTGVLIANKTYHKRSIAFKNNDTAETVNGSVAEVDNTCSIPILNRLNIGCNEFGSDNFMNGHIKSLQFYPKRLTNVELQALSI